MTRHGELRELFAQSLGALSSEQNENTTPGTSGIYQVQMKRMSFWVFLQGPEPVFELQNPYQVMVFDQDSVN